MIGIAQLDIPTRNLLLDANVFPAGGIISHKMSLQLFAHVLVLSVILLPVESLPRVNAVQAVSDWYKAFDGASGSELKQFGSIGTGRSGLERAYKLLAPEFRAHTSDPVFEKEYATVAQVKLLQAHLVGVEPDDKTAQVFVEEERTVLLEGINAVTWYEGNLHVVNVNGQWQIASFALKPEDIISGLGGHMPWRSDPVTVAEVQLGSGFHLCSPLAKNSSGEVQLTVCSDQPRAVRLTRLHNGYWHVLSVAPPIRQTR